MSLEDAADALPETLRAVTTDYALRHGIADHTELNMAEIALCGWSEAESRCRVWQFLNVDNYATLSDSGNEYGLLQFPRLPIEYLPKADAGSVNGNLIAAIQGIDRWFRANPAIMGGARVGGEIGTVEISREGLTTRTIHRFADYAEVAAAGAAVSGRILAGELSPVLANILTPVSQTVDPAAARPANNTNVQQMPGVAMSRQMRRKLERDANRRSA